MKERPILFSGEMVRAIFAGRKTQTRRGVTPQPKRTDGGFIYKGKYDSERLFISMRCPYGQPGDRLWVKETFFKPDKADPRFAGVVGDCIYRADYDYRGHRSVIGDNKWKPPFFMRREYSRITLEIETIRAERLQNISEKDAAAEGVEASKTVEMKDGSPCYTLPYQTLWNQINGCDSWETNPWVWVIEFRKRKE